MACCLVAAVLVSGVHAEQPIPENAERRPFTDPRNPPAYQLQENGERERVVLGHAVFNTQWVAAGTAGAARRDGLGPLFNASACDACHNEGAHGRGPTGSGPAPVALTIQLEVRSTRRTESSADPRYGSTLNTGALDGYVAEGQVSIRYRELEVRYPDGTSRHLRSPRYVLSGLTRGPLSARTVVQPRLAPALFGIGLLEAVSDGPAGRFGWQSGSRSIRDQTAKAFARDMGLTTADRAADDCTAAERDCLAAPNGGVPEVAAELLDAVVEFQRTLPVPESRTAAKPDAAAEHLFFSIGCVACHRASLPIAPTTLLPRHSTIAPYTDLLLHDMGPGLADRDAQDRRVASRWRTAPLWGLDYRLHTEREPTFLHDGRARSIEEAILWHAGEGSVARHRFMGLAPPDRDRLLKWVSDL